VAFWKPRLSAIFERHGWSGARQPITAGAGGTYPTFLLGDLVIKLFGGQGPWRSSFSAERAALQALATQPGVAGPRLLASGWLHEVSEAWPYLVMARVQGVAWGQAGLSLEQRLRIAAELGEQARLLGSLRPKGVAALAMRRAGAVAEAARRSALPERLIAQIGDFLAALGAWETAFVQADLMHRHVFVAGGHLAGVIDWGDAALADPHYELAKLHLDLFDGDKRLLRAFLEAGQWNPAADFAPKALALALHRQAEGLAQHATMDVFHKLPLLLPGGAGTLDRLAHALFAV